MRKLLLVTAAALWALSACAYAGEDAAYEDWKAANQDDILKVCTLSKVECLYGRTEKEFINSPDRRAHPRTEQQYRKVLGPGVSAGFSLCRDAAHVKERQQRLRDVLR